MPLSFPPRYLPAVAMTTTLLIASTAIAGSVSTPNTFVAGDTAQASEVNGNFAAHETEINDNDARIASLEATVISLTSRILTLESRSTASVLAVIDGNCNIQIATDPGLTCTRLGVGQYQLILPQGNFGTTDTFANFGLPLVTPINAAAQIGSAVTSVSSPAGVITQTLTITNTAGTPIDSTFHIIWFGTLP